MKELNNYIIEKLKINKDSNKDIKFGKYSVIMDIISSCIDNNIKDPYEIDYRVFDLIKADNGKPYIIFNVHFNKEIKYSNKQHMNIWKELQNKSKEDFPYVLHSMEDGYDDNDNNTIEFWWYEKSK